MAAMVEAVVADMAMVTAAPFRQPPRAVAVTAAQATTTATTEATTTATMYADGLEGSALWGYASGLEGSLLGTRI